MNKRDIEKVSDIEVLIDAFYSKVGDDELLGHVFNDVMKVDWKKHLPQMVDFWTTILFGAVAYKGNPMLKIYGKQTNCIDASYFERWLVGRNY